jgi:putative Mg2+ transporter-C (MgtC) family protein
LDKSDNPKSEMERNSLIMKVEDWIFVGHITLQLILACVLGGIIGWEREQHRRPAGLRTHMLICLGAALMTILSKSMGGNGDPGRIAAQIVSGVGFIGAGTILRQGNAIRGLTTAASLWSVAAIGMAIGFGQPFYMVAVIATVIVYITLEVVNRMTDRWTKVSRDRQLTLTLHAGSDWHVPMAIIAKHSVELLGFHQEPPDEPGVQVLILTLHLPQPEHANALMQSLSAAPEVLNARWEN